jgi:hypothetical protein
MIVQVSFVIVLSENCEKSFIDISRPRNIEKPYHEPRQLLIKARRKFEIAPSKHTF